MLAALPNPQHHLHMPQTSSTQSLSLQATSPHSSSDDRFCAGCNQSVNSETGGVVVAFGNSLWHVDCFKCAKCGNVVNADTTLLLLSDGSPVCANCYNCKVCHLPILDEAVMTGEDSYHAACFTCRTCHNRIDELVFAKTSQGFYCMNCHNERVARSRRHAAKNEHKKKERQGLANGSGRAPASGSGSSKGRTGASRTNGTSSPVPKSSSPTRSGYATPPPSSSDGHPHTQTVLHPPPKAHPYASSSSAPSASTSTADPEVSFADASTMSTTSATDDSVAPLPTRQPSLTMSSPQASSHALPVPAHAPQAPTSGNISSKTGLAVAQPQSRSHEPESAASPPDPMPSIDVAPPPPYSITPPADHVSSEPTSARNSASSAGSRPSSPVVSITDSRDPPSTVIQTAAPDGSTISNSSLDYLRVSPRDRVDTLPSPSNRDDGGVQWPEGFDPNSRRKSYDDGRRSSAFLNPNGSIASSEGSGWFISPLGVPNGVTSKRDKRRSINPGFQLDPAGLLQYQSQLQPVSSTSPPVSPTRSVSSSTPTDSQGHARTHSPPLISGGRDSPRLPSPLREHFTQPAEDSLDSSTTSSTVFYSPSSSPLPPRNDSPVPPAPLADTPKQTISGSTPTAPNGPVSDVILSKLPQRLDSLVTETNSSSLNPDNDLGNTGTTNPLLNGRLSPNSSAPVLRRQRSFDERDGRLSPNSNKEFSGLTKGTRSRSVSRSRSASPYKPDVPSGIESGTDTEAEEHADGHEDNDITGQAQQTGEEGLAPPLPPPKEHKTGSKIEENDVPVVQPESYPVDTSITAEISADLDDEVHDSREPSPSPPPSPVERRSAFFVAPALPPIRFSMNETDFSEILKSVGGLNSFQSLPPLHESTKSTQRSAESLSQPAAPAPPKKREEPNAASSTARSSNGRSSAPSDLPQESTPKPLKRMISKKGRTGALPERIVLKEEKPFPARDREEPASPTAIATPASPTSPNRPEVPMKSPRRLSQIAAKTPASEHRPAPRKSEEPHRPESPAASEVNGRERYDSNGSKHVDDVNRQRAPSLRSTSGASNPRPALHRQDTADLVSRRLKEALADATERNADHVKLDRGFIEAILMAMETKKEQVLDMSGKLDGMKRSSQQILDGMTVAQEEFDKELSARRDAEAEVTRLRVELSGQAARLTAMSGDDRRRELQRQMSKELTDNLDGLERDVSKLKVERDMTLAEVEELSASKSNANVVSNGDVQSATLGRSFTMRLDKIKRQYQIDLVPLTQQRETLVREIMELKEARDIFLEETTVLNARNEELAQLNAQYERRAETSHPEPLNKKTSSPVPQKPVPSFDTIRSKQAPSLANATSYSTNSSGTLVDEGTDSKSHKPQKSESLELPATQTRPRMAIRWPGNKGSKESSTTSLPSSDNHKGKGRMEHTFQQVSVLRFGRCDHCGDKTWGSQLRCSLCNIAVHARCVNHVQLSCVFEASHPREEATTQMVPPPPSMFGRNLIEQVRADSKGEERLIPIIVEKCIDAVEALAMDYEGIYRKTGGSGQSKAITQLFERGDYGAFDLRDSDLFNDISSVTSVLKNYFRALPDPLLTYALHESFVAAASIRDPANKSAALSELVGQLPKEHYHTLCHLMLHLHRVQLQSDRNRMNARNLGVVFGPTLMRSQDIGREFADMAGKALSIEWLVDNAPVVFSNSLPVH